jgi:hypothetical protein
MAEHEQNQTLGSGRVLFDRFADGTRQPTGHYRYIGNTPSFTLAQSEDKLDHFDADHGIKVKDLTVTISQDMTGTLTCDDISNENLALLFLGSATKTVIGSSTGSQETFKAVKDGYYQVGVSDAVPQGLGHITNVVVKKGSTTIAASGNYEVDNDKGIVHLLSTMSGLADDDDFIVVYDVTGHTMSQVISGNQSIYGKMFFDSTNAVGKQRDATFPYVKITPNGDYDLKSDTWQTMSFTLEILKLGNRERVYWTER